jgi:tRNA threonylcarbamoyladenosine biosynthesis protein TsaB
MCGKRQVFPANSYRIKVEALGAFGPVWQRNCPIIEYVLILALDTSSPAGSVAVLQDDKVIGTVSTSTGEIYSSRMFRHLEFLLRELSLGFEAFDVFAVAAGPGSFTGLRVGLTAVKGWAEVYNKPIAAISGLEAVAAQPRSQYSTVVPVLDARRGQIYFGCYRRVIGASGETRLALEGDECVATPDEFLATIRAKGTSGKCVIVTPTPEVIKDAVSRYETPLKEDETVRVEEASAILAPYVGRLGYLRAQRGEFADALTLDANYVRRTDAELHWKVPSVS